MIVDGLENWIQKKIQLILILKIIWNILSEISDNVKNVDLIGKKIESKIEDTTAYKVAQKVKVKPLYIFLE